MNRKLADILSFLSVAALLVMVVYLYPILPDPMPTHWNYAGEADDYESKLVAVTIFAAAPLFGIFLFKIIQIISPQGFRTEKFADVINILQLTFVVFMTLAMGIALLKGAGYDIPIEKVVPVGIGLLLMIIGNYLGKMRKNFFLGIRTPWTLASDEVWARTHRLGGWMFVLAGAVLAVGAFFRLQLEGTIVVVLAAAFVPVVYSFFIYRKLEGFAPEPPDED